MDTEGQVDRFMKRLQAHETFIQDEEIRQEEKTSPELPLSELEVGTRYLNALEEAGITTAGDFLVRLAEGGDKSLLDIKGFGQKSLIDVKRRLRARGYEIPGLEE